MPPPMAIKGHESAEPCAHTEIPKTENEIEEVKNADMKI